MSFCPKCGKKVPLEFAACPSCGQTLHLCYPTIASAPTVQKPVAAFTLTIIAAVADLFFAAFLYGYTYYLLPSMFLLFGVLFWIAAMMMFRKGSSVRSWGVVVVVFGVIGSILFLNPILSLPGIAAIFGGVVAIRWRPS